jgi:hypothetical protein
MIAAIDHCAIKSFSSVTATAMFAEIIVFRKLPLQLLHETAEIKKVMQACFHF